MKDRIKLEHAKRGQLPSDNKICFYMGVFALFTFISAFFFNSAQEILDGNLIILRSTANLTTDYFEIANVGATLVNVSIMTVQAILMVLVNRVKINGLIVASIFTLAGFSFFGKNLYNSFPIVLGVYLYSRVVRERFSKHLPVALFGTALGPLVSEVSFGMELPLHWGIPLGILAGIVAGYLMPVLAIHFATFHKGYNLYNIGFTAGLVGTFFTALFRSFGVVIDTVNLVSSGNNLKIAILLYLLFSATLLLGLRYNNWSFEGYGTLLKSTGLVDRDFIEQHRFAVTAINIALLGIFSTTFVLLLGGELNGPVLGGIFTVIGFGAYGKHMRNVLPIMLGVIAVGWISIHDINSTSVLLAALFGTTLAPVAGVFGPVTGFVIGGIHMLLVTNTSILHAGMNLYNNGFTGGLVAALTIPLIEKMVESFAKRRARSKIQ